MINYTKLIDDQIYEFKDTDLLLGKNIFLTENIGDKYLDVIFNREKKECEVFFNGSKRGKIYKHIVSIFNAAISTDNIFRKSPLDKFILRFCYSSSPEFIKAILVAIIQDDDSIRILPPLKMEQVCKQIVVPTLPFLFNGKATNYIINNFMNTKITGSVDKNGLFIYNDTGAGACLFLRQPKKAQMSQVAYDELVAEFANRVAYGNIFTEYRKLTLHVDESKEKIIENILKIVKDELILELYTMRCVNEAGIIKEEAEKRLIQSLSEAIEARLTC